MPRFVQLRTNEALSNRRHKSVLLKAAEQRLRPRLIGAAVAVLACGDVAVGTVDGRVLVFGAAPRDVAVGDGPCLVAPNGAEALAEAGAACFFVRSGVLDLWAGETHLGDLRGNSCW